MLMNTRRRPVSRRACAARWALENGILSGYSDGTFLPGGRATRGQAAVMLARYVRLLNQQTTR